MKKALIKPLLVAALLTSAITAQAHRAWILPDVTVLSGEAPSVTFDMAVSNSLFNFDHVPVGNASLIIHSPNGELLAPENLYTGKFRTVFDLTLKKEGTYHIAISSQGLFAKWEGDAGKPQFYPKRGEIFKQDEFEKVVPKNAAKLEIVQSSRRVETFVSLGKPSAFTLTQQGLELKAVTHPNDLFVGEKAKFQFYMDGKAVEGVDVTVIREGTRYRNDPQELKYRTDKNGEIEINWNGAGRYYLAASYKDNQAQKPASSRAGSYAAVFEVLPE
ncbi:MAG: hypothetical protein RL217_1190 [Pseudomonadota bacterium]|jgi:uncharacterized GH25 family protein